MDLLNILIFVLVLYVIYKGASLAIGAINNRAGKKLEDNMGHVLNQTFSGSPTAVYEVLDVGTLKFGQVVAGAEERGYTLHAQNEQKNGTTLVFKKES